METRLMSNDTEKMLTTGWNLVRDAGSVVTDVAVKSGVGKNIARNLPRVKDMVTTGAGLALAKRGGKMAVAVVRKNPVAAIAGAVALAGVGMVYAAVKKRKAARDSDAVGKPPRARRLTATNMRDGAAAAPAKAAAKKARVPRVRKAKAPAKS